MGYNISLKAALPLNGRLVVRSAKADAKERGGAMNAATFRRFVVKESDYEEWTVIVEADSSANATRKAEAIYRVDNFGVANGFDLGWKAQPLVQEVRQCAPPQAPFATALSRKELQRKPIDHFTTGRRSPAS
ncbi:MULTISPECIES: hypothetical protein [unclassified Bradyrhizobium]|uniref:hypothetical protein n=1 Tax=unclassified Bradyrhizobium TaxID=2631580 RepID=UPI001CD4FEB1|nr:MULTISPECIES: hypothetical protein [unclassified Bradyrhizobium]MCA1471183.1 hypothetical protein [Bradyrhizobium sp. IC3195]MCA1500246.1 hypothetical protein [Bradyrhizobium sp. NBAIM14]